MPILKEPNGTYKVDISLGTNRLNKQRIRTTRRGIPTYQKAKMVEAKILHYKSWYNTILTVKQLMKGWYNDRA